MKKIIIIFLMVFMLGGCNDYTEKIEKSNIIIPSGTTLETRISVPDGYERIAVNEGSIAEFLRGYKMKEDGSPVLLYNNKKRGNQNSHAAVFNLPIENMDLQQCADSVMRVYAEYYWNLGEQDKIAFHFTDGFLCEYSKWRDGYRVIVGEGTTRWEKRSSFDDSYENFVKYLRVVFSYAGTSSMETLETETISLSDMTVGDVILKGGTPGHVVMVVDRCENKDGKKAYLLAQGYMPAQEFHVIKNPKHNNDPWYYEDDITFPLRTAEYTFENEDMIKRLKY